VRSTWCTLSEPLWLVMRALNGTHRKVGSASIYRMTDSQLEAILDRLEMLAPQSRLSDKRARLAAVRERLLALHARGHSWRAIAREISATGESVSADLLRAICIPKAKRRGRAARGRSDAPPAIPTAPRPQPATLVTKTNTTAFGAKGLKI
jgi:hypothetical protein